MRLLAAGASVAVVCVLAASGAAAPSAFPGRNGAIAFVRSPLDADGEPTDPDIWVVNPDASGLLDLTPDPLREDDPGWSPDGRLLAFTQTPSAGAGETRIFLISADGSDRHGLTAGPGSDRSPAWSPDGSRIAFERERPNSAGSELWLVNVDGTGLRRLTGAGRERFDSAPAWSPDGQTIAFFREAPGANASGLYFVRPSGKGLHRAGTTALGTSLAWTPTGRLSPERGWSPDGRLLAVARPMPDAPDRSEIFIARRDGGRPVRITNGPDGSAAYDPVWQPRCTITGTAGPDRLVGTPGPDVICGLGGADRIKAGAGDDRVIGGEGPDRIDGGPGRDVLLGGAGNDTIEGRDRDRDVLDGGPGRDVLRGDRRDRLSP